ncbi:MAG: Dps family protein [Actinomycetota bacterium]
MTNIRLPLDAERREVAAAELQSIVVDLVDLSLQGKQAHWNVVGRHFTPVHEQLDALVTDARAWVDALAERVAALGHSPDGRAQAVASSSRVEPFPDGFVADDKAVALVADRIASVVESTRGSLDRLGTADLVSQDLAIEVLGGLEKHLWMFQAQTS